MSMKMPKGKYMATVKVGDVYKRQTQDLLHLVGNINDAAAAVPQHIDDAEQVLSLIHI